MRSLRLSYHATSAVPVASTATSGVSPVPGRRVSFAEAVAGTSNTAAHDQQRTGNAAERTRTSTGLPPQAPEACAYTNFATAAGDPNCSGAAAALISDRVYYLLFTVLVEKEFGDVADR